MTTRSHIINKQRTAPHNYIYLFLFAVIIGSSFIFISIRYGTEIRFLNRAIIDAAFIIQDYPVNKGFTIKTNGCTISALEPFNDNIKKFVKYPTDIEPCPLFNISLLDNNETHIWIVKNNYYYYNITDYEIFICCYKSFNRPNLIIDINSKYIDNRVHYDECIYFSDFIEVLNEFVRVTCDYLDENIYDQFFLFAPKKELTVTYKPFKSELKESEANIFINKNETNYNIIIMGVDAVSRMNFYRTMPKTLAYLKYKDAIELLGYNKVGDNTFPNIVPLLMGINVNDIKKTCLPNGHSTFDNCPFVWQWFKEKGYYTALGEDSAVLGTFNYLKVGFAGTPTDYYLYTFMRESEIYSGNNKDFNSFLCMGSKYYYRVLLDYIQKLSSTLKSSKLFGFFWEVTMSHDHLNYPMAMDESYELFFKNLDKSQYLDKTVLIILSDHGIRWGEIRNTKQGRLEERLPFVYILLPPEFRKSYESAYNNIKTNAKRLTTPYDLHEMLMDLVNMDILHDDAITKRIKKSYAINRGISLFLPIPNNRTCKAAGIEDHWCTCQKGKKLQPNQQDVADASHHLMRHLNFLLRGRPQCARLNMVEIIYATEMEVAGLENVGKSWRELTLAVRAAPSNAIFEATLRRDDEWIVTGSVSRLNIYGDQSRCVDDYRLKLYCYCQ